MFKLISLLITIFVVTYVNTTPLELTPELASAIVNGAATRIDKHPWQVSLILYGRHHCGGSIYNEKIIVTAAHCANNREANIFQIRAGSSYSNKGGTIIQVAAVLQHENYGRVPHDNDIAVLRLSSPLTYNTNIQPIALATTAPADGTAAIVTGWGDTRPKLKLTQEILRAAQVNMISNSRCGSNDFEYGKRRLKASMICAAAPGTDSCQGDSGGPLVANGVLVGVTSWGEGCADPMYPGVYADVAYLNAWITSAAKRV